MNGAGPKGWGWLVPDQLGLVNIENAANIHDAQYYWVAEISNMKISKIPLEKIKYLTRGKSYADKTFYKNLKLINKEQSPTWVGYMIRKPIIFIYYIAVVYFGGHFIKK